MKRASGSVRGIGAVALVAVILVVLAAVFLLVRNRQSGRDGKTATESALPSAAAPSAPKTAPPFSLPDVNGNLFSSESFAGKPTVINFFATWCPPCRNETPGFVEVYNRHRGKGLEMIGISLDTDTRGNLAGFLMTHRIEYRILYGDLATARAYGGVSSIPTTFFIGKDGEIKNIHVGYIDKDAFDAEVRKLL
ncbi:MAG: TlpA family protein disulfide reductase [Deltaproteobacteria bacterium]|nr:TlpA family protein disulfide reductase [Deltaproteobacteria bacterium]